MACQAPTSLTRRLVSELKAQGQDKGEHAFDKRFAIAKQLIIGRFVLKVDGNGPFSRVWRVVWRMGHPQGRWLVWLMTQHGECLPNAKEQ